MFHNLTLLAKLEGGHITFAAHNKCSTAPLASPANVPLTCVSKKLSWARRKLVVDTLLIFVCFFLVFLPLDYYIIIKVRKQGNKKKKGSRATSLRTPLIKYSNLTLYCFLMIHQKVQGSLEYYVDYVDYVDYVVGRETKFKLIHSVLI
jgi:hypothetical protein